MLFNRTASLITGKSGGKGRELSGLRFAFSIQKGATKSPNKCTVRVWNMAPDTRAQVEVIGNVLLLKAGYLDDQGALQIFAGDLTRALTRRDGADLVTELELQDGHLEFRDKKLALSFASGVSGRTVLETAAASFGLPVRTLPDFTDKQYSAGFAFIGRTRDALDKVCKYLGLEWSIQGREVQIVRAGATIKQQAVVLSADTGLIGSPELDANTMTEQAAAKDGFTASQKGVRVITELDELGKERKMLQIAGYKVRSLLQPTLEPGALVQLKARGVTEFLRIDELTHTGDTHGQEWVTEMTLRFPK
jgi:hypothetical protein